MYLRVTLLVGSFLCLKTLGESIESIIGVIGFSVRSYLMLLSGADSFTLIVLRTLVPCEVLFLRFWFLSYA